MTDFFSGSSKKQLLFVLKNINIVDVDKQYNMELISGLNSVVTEKNNTEFTPIDKIGIKDLKKSPLSTYVTKDKIKSLVYVTFEKNIDENEHKCKCHGCHRYFDSYPLGIPISYKLNENKEYYLLDSLVCSFNCMYLVLENSYSPIYKNSSFLINKLYHTIYGEFPKQKIIKSPNWKLQKCYGGPLDEDEYAKCFQSILFNDLHTIQKIESCAQRVGRLFDIKDEN